LIGLTDNTREVGQIEVRAAEYFEDQNLLLINADFRVFTDMIERWCRAYGDVGWAHATVEEVVHEWFEQTLVEAVLGAQASRDDREGTKPGIAAALSKEALTAAVMPRYHVDIAIKRALGSKLGTLRDLTFHSCARARVTLNSGNHPAAYRSAAFTGPARPRASAMSVRGPGSS
jgi:hypothetical protein